MNPRVTIYIPVYNAERWIRRTIESCLNQTYSDFELLLVDDGSTDASVDIIKSFEDPRIRLICSEVNQGIAKTSNIAIENARGEYIARLDHDDVMRPDRLEIEVDYLDSHPEVTAIGGDILVHHSDGTTEESNMPNIEDRDQLLVQCQCFCPIINITSMYRRSFVMENNIRHNPDYVIADDYRFFFDIVKAGGFIDNINIVLTDYYIHGENASIKFSHTQLADDIKIRLEAAELIFDRICDKQLTAENEYREIVEYFNKIEDEQERLKYLDKFLKICNLAYGRWLM